MVVAGWWHMSASQDTRPRPTTLTWTQATHTTPQKPLITGAIVPTVADFRGVRWGSAPSRGMQKLSNAVWKNAGKTLSPYHGVPVAEEGYFFEEGKLYAGQLYIDGADNFGRVKTALMHQFGSPSFANEALRIFKWKASGVEARLHYQEKFQRTTVHIEKAR